MLNTIKMAQTLLMSTEIICYFLKKWSIFILIITQRNLQIILNSWLKWNYTIVIYMIGLSVLKNDGSHGLLLKIQFNKAYFLYSFFLVYRN